MEPVDLEYDDVELKTCPLCEELCATYSFGPCSVCERDVCSACTYSKAIGDDLIYFCGACWRELNEDNKV